MTEKTMKEVTADLVTRGIPATFEYPGFISCQCSHGMSLAAGDANATIGADIMDYRWECIESLQSDIPSDSTDIKRIADWIAASYTGEPNATEEVKPHA